jgi:hypothetical protein
MLPAFFPFLIDRHDCALLAFRFVHASLN